MSTLIATHRRQQKLARPRASGVVAVISSALLLGGCAGGTTQSQGPPLKAVSVQEYGATLVRTIDPLESALKALAKAKAYKGLDDRVAAVETAAAEAATKLSHVTPPAELAGEHSQLVTATQAFQTELGNVSSQVSDRALCTGSTVRAELGNSDATSALRDAVAALSAKLPDERPDLKLPRGGQEGGSRPPNGKLLRAGNTGGRSELTIGNGGSADAVVTLSKSGKPVISVYVRKDKTYTVKSVPDGSYSVFFTGGSGWDGTARAFGRDCAFSRFEDPLEFRTTRDATGIYWQNFTITLQPVAGGTARTEDVNPNDFPS